MTRAEHLRWAKDRAMDYANSGDFANAFASFTSDLTKHPELTSALELQMSLGSQMFFGGMLNSLHEMSRWIEGFN